MSTTTLLAKLFDEHAPDIYRYLARRVGTSVAEELLSQTFLTAVEKIDRFDPDKGQHRAWLFGIATNQIRQCARAEARQLAAYSRVPLALAAQDDDAESIACRLDAKAQGRKLATAIAGLPSADRDVLLLYAWAELSYAEIATTLNIPVGTVRSRLHRTRKALSLAEQTDEHWEKTS